MFAWLMLFCTSSGCSPATRTDGVGERTGVGCAVGAGQLSTRLLSVTKLGQCEHKCMCVHAYFTLGVVLMTIGRDGDSANSVRSCVVDCVTCTCVVSIVGRAVVNVVAVAGTIGVATVPTNCANVCICGRHYHWALCTV